MKDFLLVTSPDRQNHQGGLFLIANKTAYLLDCNSSLGLCISKNMLIRGVYPNKIHAYNCAGFSLEKEDSSFEDIHDVLFLNDHYYIVGTELNVVIKIDLSGKEIQRWTLGVERDSCHINCLSVIDNRIVYSAFGSFNSSRGYKGNTQNKGFLKDLISGETLVSGLSQPHSPTVFGNNFLIANSENFELQEYSVSGELVRSKKMDGYTRGICVSEQYIYVGISKLRKGSSQRIDSAVICILDKISWKEEHRIAIPADEIYALAIIDNKDYFDNLLPELVNKSVVDLKNTLLKINSKPWIVLKLNKIFISVRKRLVRLFYT